MQYKYKLAHNLEVTWNYGRGYRFALFSADWLENIDRFHGPVDGFEVTWFVAVI